jgi:hypothetical protein
MLSRKKAAQRRAAFFLCAGKHENIDPEGSTHYNVPKMKPVLLIILCASLFLWAGPGESAHRASSATLAQNSSYGEKRPVRTKKEAREILKEHLKGRNLRVGKIEEKELYFEAEILDARGNVVDRLIVQKQTGRIRSIY